jgi:signal transduction histidine kinase
VIRTVGRALRSFGGSVGTAVWSADAGELPWARPRRYLPWLFGAYGVIVAVSVAGASLNERGGQPGGVGFLLLLPLAAALALAPSRPLDAWRGGTVWLIVVPYLLAPPQPAVAVEPWGWLLWGPLLLLGMWGAPGRGRPGVAAVSGLAGVALVFGTPWPVPADELGVTGLGIAVPLVLGTALGSRWDARRALAAERQRAAAAQAERGALAERARIAREMHDIVAHHMSMIAVRCETAPYRLGELSEPARAELSGVATAAREALTEMQALLGVLRATDATPDRSPQPGIADIEPLLVEARAAGARLTWEIAEVDLPAPVGLTVFRIVQQGLANAAQHAPGAPVHVLLEADPPAVEIVNEPGRGPSTPGGGTGIPAMRERARVHGGTLEAGPTDRGFRLRAVLPGAGR